MVNLPSTLKLPHVIDKEITSELTTKRMSGPFSIAQDNAIFGRHFCMSPLGLVEKLPGSGKWRTISHQSKEDTSGDSMNGWLNADDFPTKYYLANTTADLMQMFFTMLYDMTLTFDPYCPS